MITRYSIVHPEAYQRFRILSYLWGKIDILFWLTLALQIWRPRMTCTVMADEAFDVQYLLSEVLHD